MKIFTRICAIASIVLFLLTLLLVFGVTLGQNLIMELMGYSDSILGGFSIPWTTLIYTVLWLICAAALCIGTCTDKTGIVIEIIFLVLAVLILPVAYSLLSNLFSLLQTVVYPRYIGMNMLTHKNIVMQIVSYVTFLNPVAMALAYLSCGLSLGRKVTEKRLTK